MMIFPLILPWSPWVPDSVNSTYLILYLEKEFDIELNIDEIILSESILQIKEIVLKAMSNDTKQVSVNQLSATKGKHDLLLIHPGNGALFQYAELVQTIATEFTVFGLQNQLRNDLNAPFSSISDMASFYIRLLKDSELTAPYVLAGWSSGGSIAIEMAKQLEEQGEKVSLVMLIDSWTRYTERFRDREFFESIFREKTRGSDLLNYSLLWSELYWLRTQVLLAHTPSHIQANCVLFKADTLAREYIDLDSPDNGWQNYVSNLEIVNIQGDHESILKGQNAIDLSRQFNRILSQHILEQEAL